jgi:hypothetical protein
MEHRAELVVRHRNELVHVGSLVAVGLGAVGFAAFLTFGFSLGVFGVHLGILGVFLQAFVRMNGFAVRRVETVHITENGIRTTKEEVPRARIATGYYQPRVGSTARDRSSVVLLDRSRRVVFEAEVENEPAAEALLRAVGLDATQKSVEFRAVSRYVANRTVRVVLAATVGVLAVFLRAIPGAFAAPWLIAIGVSFAAALAMPAKIVIGVDGVLVKWLWTKRFIPIGDIVEVAEEGPFALRLRRRSGRDEVIHTTTKNTALTGHLRQRRDAMIARIEAARRAHAIAGPRADVSALLARGERSASEWRHALRALTSDRGYREASVRAEDLLRVVEDPRAPEDVRAAAATVVASSNDDAAKTRIRVVAEATASPKLRVVLDAVAEGSPEDVDRALDEVAADETHAAASSG